MHHEISFRFAEEKEIPLILDFVRRLAVYEDLADEVVATEEDMADWLFRREIVETLFVLDGEIVAGMALFFHNFSTFLGKGGIYVEDLFILPEYRGKGLGRALLAKICALAKERGCGRVDWACLRSNETGLGFYHSLNAVSQDEWIGFRLTGADLDALAKKEAATKTAAKQKGTSR